MPARMSTRQGKFGTVQRTGGDHHPKDGGKEFVGLPLYQPPVTLGCIKSNDQDLQCLKKRSQRCVRAAAHADRGINFGEHGRLAGIWNPSSRLLQTGSTALEQFSTGKQACIHNAQEDDVMAAKCLGEEKTKKPQAQTQETALCPLPVFRTTNRPQKWTAPSSEHKRWMRDPIRIDHGRQRDLFLLLDVSWAHPGFPAHLSTHKLQPSRNLNL
ncbi:hypothetical protein IWX49DRAFT_380796 [Phyllosticta citricarpa]|uniref:Uncharacterized protein n=2 Tax=Phyllosticta TaxID=121621 RepID=A0ABR1L5I3_9PEZI